MKEITFTKNSWIFKILCFLNSRYEYHPPSDICALGRALFFSGIKFLFIVSLVTAFISMAGMAVIEKSEYEFTFLHMSTIKAFPWYLKLPVALVYGAGTLTSLVGSLLGIAFVVVHALNLLDNARYKFCEYFIVAAEEPKPNMIVAAYKAFKEKTCYKIKFD